MTTTIVPTIENHTNGLIVTSETIAHGAGVEHRAVLQLLKNRSAEIESFGQVAFEMRAGYNNVEVRTALLNEPQSTLLMTFMRNTAQVIVFKVALVKAFYQMRNLIESPIVQEALFGMDHDGFILGQPVSHLPAAPGIGKRHDPRVDRNQRLAHVVKAASGAWVPVTIDGFTEKQHKQFAVAVRTGGRKSFPRGQYDAAIRDNTLYIRHNDKEIAS